MTKEQEKLVLEHVHLAKREARRWRHTPMEQDDLIAEGYLILCRAAKRFSPSRGVEFAAYATIRLRGGMKDIIRSRSIKTAIDGGRNRDSDTDPEFFREISISCLSDPQDDEKSSCEIVDHKADVERIVENLDTLNIIKSLPDKERYILIRSALDGASATEIAKELNVGVARVEQLSSRATKRARIRREGQK